MDGSDPLATPFDRFAPFYDGDYRNYFDDIEAIGVLAEEAGDPILELGCGTGRVLMPLALAGHHITGVDLSPALLDIAGHKVAEQRLQQQVELICADLLTMQLPRRNYAFAYCTSNTLMHFTTQADQLSVLRTAFHHLRPGGHFLIDLFNPDVQRLTAINGLMELADRWEGEGAGHEVVKWSVRTVDWAEQLQETVFIYESIQPSGQSTRTACPFMLRFLWRGEAELLLKAAGFVVEDVWGDFDGGGYDATRDHLILLAHKE
ncbi:MAG: class I SAM-dependent methyltransferase [Anaerolineales bacterium]|nr:class I SAM-dependent methyltransferase [Anaerolineales bacterium]